MSRPADFSRYHVGVFDSGRGGQQVAESLAAELPGLRLSVLGDSKNIPYGRKTSAEMLACVEPFMERFTRLKVDAVVIACNTCFTNLAPELRHLFAGPMIGYEPYLVAAAVASRSRNVLVCATAGTLKSHRWQAMKDAAPADLKICELDCTDWVGLVEADAVGDDDLQPALDIVLAENVDSFVLGCTHYHCLEGRLSRLLPPGKDLKFYQPTPDIVAQLRRLLGPV